MPISRIETNSIASSQTLTTPIIATTMGVGGATPAGSGSGITFPAAQSASSNVNTLDDYEEGTFSPVIDGWTGTYSSQFGLYTKIGRLIHCYGLVRTNGGTGSFSNAYPGIAGLPIAGGIAGSAAEGMWFVVSGSTGLTSSQTASGPLDGPATGTAAFPNWVITGGNVTNWTNSQINAASNVEYRFFITYVTA